jgi:glycosyltransferase involved in cell wall biosynthesis
LPAFPPFQDNGKIRVGFVCPCLINGGAESWQLALARSLDGRFQIQGVAIHSSTYEATSVKAYEGICPVSEGENEIRNLARNVDILVVWGYFDFGLLSILTTKPLTVSVCHIPKEWEAGLYRITSDIDRFVAVSPSALECIPDELRDKAVIIPNAIDPKHLETSRTRDDVRASWNVQTSDYVVGYLGRLSPEKNPAAMIELARIATEVKVVLVGSGGLLHDLQVAAEGLDNVRLVEADHRAGDVLQAFDTLVVPSNFESYGLSLVEGLAVGCPVISTSVGVAKENPGLTRVVEATGRDLWEALQADRSDPDGTRSRVEASKAWVASHATLEAFGKRWSDHLAGLPIRPRTIQPKAKGCGCGKGQSAQESARREQLKQEAIRRALNK